MSQSPEKARAWIEVSNWTRTQITSVFDRFGKPLSASLGGNSGFPISVETGGNSLNYRLKWTQAATGGMFPDFAYWDRRVWDAVASQAKTQRQLNSEVQYLGTIQADFRAWDLEYSTRAMAQNAFYERSSPVFEAGWNLVNNWVAEYILDAYNNPFYLQKKSGIVLTPEEERLLNGNILAYNRAQSEAQVINNSLNEAWSIRNTMDSLRTWQLNYVHQVHGWLSVADQKKYDAERGRYRWILWWVDFDKKVGASQQAFKDIYGKAFWKDQVSGYYGNAMDSLGMLMTRIQTGGVITEADYRKEMVAIGKSLSDEEKMIFLGMIWANLGRLTYNWDTVKTGKYSQVKPFESMQSLAKAFQTGETVPAWVCSSIHVAVASIAESWGTPAGTLSVSSGWIAHIVALMDIWWKKVISDYGKIYTANTMEELIDTYAIANKWIAVRNYITNASGKIIGHVDTPLTKAFRREVLSETILSEYISNGKLPEDGVSISLYTDRRSIRGQYTFENGIYIRGKYSEATLIPSIKTQSSGISIWKKWKDLDLGWGWNWEAYIEWSMSRSNLNYNGERSSANTNIGELQGGIRWVKDLGNGNNIYAGVGTNIIAQGTRPTIGEYPSIWPLWTGTAAESGLTAKIWGTWQVTNDTRFSSEVSAVSHVAPNIQSTIWLRELNPTKAGYTETMMRVWWETRVWKWIVSAKIEHTKWPLSSETTAWVGYSGGSIGASIEQTKIIPTSVFAPSAQNIIRANIEWTFSEKWNGKWFAWVEKWGIWGKQAKVWAKWTF